MGKHLNPRIRKIALCHPEKEYGGKGLCSGCYKNKWRMDRRRAAGIPPLNKRNSNSYVVYVYANQEGLPLYVGRGTMDRALEHKYPYKNSTWWSENLTLLTMTCKDGWESMEYEGRWGGFYHPIANRDGNKPFKHRWERREKKKGESVIHGEV